MKISIGESAYLFSKRGILRASEIREGDLILGADKKGRNVHKRVEKLSKVHKISNSLRLFTDAGLLVVGKKQKLWTDEGLSCAKDIAASPTRTYGGTRLDTLLHRSITKWRASKRKTPLIEEDAYALGVFSRMINNRRKGIVVRVPDRKLWSEDALKKICASRFVSGAKLVVREGFYWDWFRFTPSSDKSNGLLEWDLEKTVPFQIRNGKPEIVKEYVQGCLDVRQFEDVFVFDLWEQEILSFCCMVLMCILQKEFLLKLSPVYAPAEFKIDTSKSSDSRVRSIIPCTSKEIAVEFQDEKLWTTYVNGFLVTPLQ